MIYKSTIKGIALKFIIKNNIKQVIKNITLIIDNLEVILSLVDILIEKIFIEDNIKIDMTITLNKIILVLFSIDSFHINMDAKKMPAAGVGSPVK